jgi:hypothetical protein
MTTEFQLRRLDEAMTAIREKGKVPTAGTIWQYLSMKYPRRPGFKGRRAVGQHLKTLRKKKGREI